jgi:hypothetical protein
MREGKANGSKEIGFMAYISNITSFRTYTQMVGTNEGAKHFTRWMMYSGRLKQFALAKRLLFNSE